MTNSSRRGGPRHIPDEEKIKKLQRIKRLYADGYPFALSCRRAGTTETTANKWARNLNFNLK